jgi:hypothetical protein
MEIPAVLNAELVQLAFQSRKMISIMVRIRKLQEKYLRIQKNLAYLDCFQI